MELDVRRQTQAVGARTGAQVNIVLSHSLPQLSASLTYFTVLSLFPALIVIVALLGAVGLPQSALRTILDGVAGTTDSQWVVDLVSGALASVFQASNTSLFLGLGVLAMIWTASAYVGAFAWACDRLYETEDGRPFWKSIPRRLVLSLLLMVLFAAAVAMVTFIGPLGSRLGDALGLRADRLVPSASLALPLLLAAGWVLLALLFKYAPSRRQPPLWRLLAGAAVTVVLWIVVSTAFSYYLSHFGAYNRVYGTLGALVAFLVWAWLLNLGVLIGVEVNRALETGVRDDRDALADTSDPEPTSGGG
jgi:membrane protein